VGFLNVNSTKPGQFNSADAQRLQAFASHAATAIQNARLYRELLNHAEQLERRVQERTAQLQAQYAQLEAILDSSSDGIIVTDGQGEILQTNPIAQTWLSRTLLPEDAARLQEAVHDLAGRAEERPETVLELTGMDLQLSAAPITEPGMDEAAAVIAIHDISHLKALDRMKSRFVSNVSHELRTPITTIKLYAALMQRSPEKWKEYLDVLVQEADRQALLVEDILQISHIDSGRLEMKPRPTPLNELTEMSVLNHRVLAEGQGLTLEHRPAEPEPVALVDPDRVTQVLTNLIANAINYTPEGRKVTISTGQEEAEGRIWATVTVADTGMGIPEEELPHVFERFFRGEQPRAMQVSGSGLGLAIAKEIVELQGGRVTVESEVDAGTSFTVWLPVAD
ncbi:MAG: PAS domain-containing protein, partial [Chloroflexi bacterium]|nr:PAS domain-containing protein [Chloroflexota bacterium]